MQKKTAENAKTAAEIINLPAAVLRLVINYIVVYNFGDSAANVIHPSNPLHLIVCFEFFGYALTLRHLFYKSKNIKCPKALCFQGLPGTSKPVCIIPTRQIRIYYSP